MMIHIIFTIIIIIIMHEYSCLVSVHISFAKQLVIFKYQFWELFSSHFITIILIFYYYWLIYYYY